MLGATPKLENALDLFGTVIFFFVFFVLNRANAANIHKLVTFIVFFLYFTYNSQNQDIVSVNAGLNLNYSVIAVENLTNKRKIYH